jgi:RES domain-containing protein
MTRKRRARSPEGRTHGGAPEPDLPSLLELERFNEASLHQWRSAKGNLDALHRALYFELEPLRQRNESQLVDALRSQALPAYAFEGWSRIVDYRYSLEPLSVAGSLKGDGGRFNVGAELSPGAFPPFPALYVAEDYDTAFRERFGARDKGSSKNLTPSDMALRSPASFSQVRLKGSVEQVIDIGDLESLRPFTDVLKSFPIPKNVLQTARRLGLRHAPWLIRSPTTLQRQLLHPNWRMLPVQFDLPSNSQIFGRLASAAGLHGILYPSVRQQGKRCLALFTQNWANSASNIQVSDGVPEGARFTRVDGAGNA